MTESEGKLRVVLITFFPMLIATLSLVTSIFNGYLNNKFVDLIQHNFGRAEYMRTCKETIDAYFQVKFKAGLVSANGEHARAGTAAISSAERIDQLPAARARDRVDDGTGSAHAGLAVTRRDRRAPLRPARALRRAAPASR